MYLSYASMNCMHACVCMYEYMYICMYVCIYIYIYIYYVCVYVYNIDIISHINTQITTAGACPYCMYVSTRVCSSYICYVVALIAALLVTIVFCVVSSLSF